MQNEAGFGTPKENDESFEINMDEAQESERVPRGLYKAKMVSVKKQISKSSGNPMLVWGFVITEDNRPGQKVAGREFPMYTVLTAGALWKVKEVLLALGMQPPAIIKSEDLQALVGTECKIALDDDEYQGVKKSKLVKVWEKGFIG